MRRLVRPLSDPGRWLAWVLALLALPCAGQQFRWDAPSCQAYALLLDLRFAEADSLLSAISASDPQNLTAPYLQDLSDFLTIVVTEDEQEFNRRAAHRDRRIRQLETADLSDPFRNVALGELQLHWAFSNMRFGNYLNGAMGIRKAFQLLEDNMQRFPSFLHTYKGMGLLHTLVGTVPDNYKWAARLMGVDGTVPQGIAEMRKVMDGHSGRKEFGSVRKETLFLFTFLQLNLVNDEDALRHVKQHLERQSGPLMAFAHARVLRKEGQTDQAISLLERTLKKQPSAFPYLQFLLGDMKLCRLDADADKPLLAYLRMFKGKSYMKAAHGKMAWHAIAVRNDPAAYRDRMGKAISAPESMTDEDKSAQREAEGGKLPHRVLLRARLLSDGAYFDAALKELTDAPASTFDNEEQRLERSYRLGRICHGAGNLASAKQHYAETMADGAASPRYFAANAALQLGLIYEQEGNKELARKHFKAATSFKNTEYRNSIAQKAKAGLMRL